MIDLARTIRFCVNLASHLPVDRRPADAGAAQTIHNPFAGWPSMVGLGAYYELEVLCRGEPDRVTGYLMNISAIDKAVRDHAIPLIENAVRTNPQVDPGAVLASVIPLLQPHLNQTIASIRWRLTPYYSVTMNASALDRIIIAQQFEFSASHRLHVPELGEARNREIFGKCNNPSSHGHNYRIEAAVETPVETQTSKAKEGEREGMSLQQLEQIVDETILKRFDHKHLNLDTPEFSRLNPSVENIAKVCHDLLRDPIANAGGALRHVTVWETEKTSCRYPAGPA